MDEYIQSDELEVVLQKWIQMNRSMTELWDWVDSPWWCGEKAAVNLLSSAVWQAGGMALAEWECKRVGGQSDSSGFCDLCFSLSDNHYVAEAKYLYAPVGSRAGSAVRKVKAELAKACKEVQTVKLEEEDQEKLLGLVFAVPYLPVSDIDRVDDCLAILQNGLRELKYDHLAWVFPPETRTALERERCIHPGIVLMIKEI